MHGTKVGVGQLEVVDGSVLMNQRWVNGWY